MRRPTAPTVVNAKTAATASARTVDNDAPVRFGRVAWDDALRGNAAADRASGDSGAAGASVFGACPDLTGG